jgi:DNA-directed RNA polymerase subunit RPC12/RpoP
MTFDRQIMPPQDYDEYTCPHCGWLGTIAQMTIYKTPRELGIDMHYYKCKRCNTTLASWAVEANSARKS